MCLSEAGALVDLVFLVPIAQALCTGMLHSVSLIDWPQSFRRAVLRIMFA